MNDFQDLTNAIKDHKNVIREHQEIINNHRNIIDTLKDELNQKKKKIKIDKQQDYRNKWFDYFKLNQNNFGDITVEVSREKKRNVHIRVEYKLHNDFFVYKIRVCGTRKLQYEAFKEYWDNKINYEIVPDELKKLVEAILKDVVRAEAVFPIGYEESESEEE
jgi:hypothetical protein